MKTKKAKVQDCVLNYPNPNSEEATRPIMHWKFTASLM